MYTIFLPIFLVILSCPSAPVTWVVPRWRGRPCVAHRPRRSRPCTCRCRCPPPVPWMSPTMPWKQLCIAVHISYIFIDTINIDIG